MTVSSRERERNETHGGFKTNEWYFIKWVGDVYVFILIFTLLCTSHSLLFVYFTCFYKLIIAWRRNYRKMEKNKGRFIREGFLGVKTYLFGQWNNWNAIAIIDLELKMGYEIAIMCCAQCFTRGVIFQKWEIYLAGHLKGYTLSIVHINSLHKRE